MAQIFSQIPTNFNSVIREKISAICVCSNYFEGNLSSINLKLIPCSK